MLTQFPDFFSTSELLSKIQPIWLCTQITKINNPKIRSKQKNVTGIPLKPHLNFDGKIIKRIQMIMLRIVS